MGDWKGQLAAAERMRQAKLNMTAEQKAEMKRKAAATRAKNREAKLAAGGAITKPGRKPKGTDLDELAQQMGFGSAAEAMLDMACKKAGFGSVQEAAMWAVKERAKKTPADVLVAALPAKWDDEG